MKFFSTYPQGLYWLIPTRVQFDQFGQRREVQGKNIQFNNGVFETDDEETIAQIKGLNEFGGEITSEGKNEMTAQQAAHHNAEKKAVETTGAKGCPFCSFKAAEAEGLPYHIKEKHPEKA